MRGIASDSSLPRRIALATGGTAGHVYPALAVSEELRRRDPDVQVFFVGTPAGRERSLIEANGYDIVLVPGSPYYGGGIGRIISSVWNLGRGVLAARNVLRRRRIEAVVGFGGYAAAGTLLAARTLGIWTALVEPNAVPGRANRFSAPGVDRVYLGMRTEWPDPNDKRILRVGTPVRRNIIDAAARRAPRTPASFRVLVLGDRFLSDRVPDLLRRVARSGVPVAVLHVDTMEPPDYGDTVVAHMDGHRMDMGSAYGSADFVICRAGASTTAEAAIHGLPTLFVPLSSAAEDHQSRNAALLERSGSALVVSEAAWDADALALRIAEIATSDAAWEEQSRRIRAIATPDAARAIVDDLATLGSGRGE